MTEEDYPICTCLCHLKNRKPLENWEEVCSCCEHPNAMYIDSDMSIDKLRYAQIDKKYYNEFYVSQIKKK